MIPIHLTYHLGDKFLGHMAVRTTDVDAGAVVEVAGLLDLGEGDLHLVAAGTEGIRAGRMHAPVEGQQAEHTHDDTQGEDAHARVFPHAIPAIVLFCFLFILVQLCGDCQRESGNQRIGDHAE